MLAEDKMFTDRLPPMTVKVFQDKFSEELKEKVITRSINRSCDVAHDFIDKFMKIKVRNVGIQTKSIDDLVADHLERIHEQRSMLKAAEIHETSILAELNRVTKKLSESLKEQEQLKETAERAEQERKFMFE